MYAESISFSINEFMEMMLFDGCFIIQLFHRYAISELRYSKDPIFNMDWILGFLVRAGILFDNPVPCFVLNQFFNMIMVPNVQCHLIVLIYIFFSTPFPCPGNLKHCRGNFTDEITSSSIYLV
ncbi:hypothetical protein ACOSQ2_001509 [Xanthoceras sorbifolium]